MAEQDQQISDAIRRERNRLRNFIRRRVPDPRDAEDVLQDVFYKLVEANRLLMPIEHVTGWLFRVARNRIADLFRKDKEVGIRRPSTRRQLWSVREIHESSLFAVPHLVFTGRVRS